MSKIGRVLSCGIIVLTFSISLYTNGYAQTSAQKQRQQEDEIRKKALDQDAARVRAETQRQLQIMRQRPNVLTTPNPDKPRDFTRQITVPR